MDSVKDTEYNCASGDPSFSPGSWPSPSPLNKSDSKIRLEKESSILKHLSWSYELLCVFEECQIRGEMFHLLCRHGRTWPGWTQSCSHYLTTSFIKVWHTVLKNLRSVLLEVKKELLWKRWDLDFLYVRDVEQTMVLLLRYAIFIRISHFSLHCYRGKKGSLRWRYYRNIYWAVFLKNRIVFIFYFSIFLFM